MDSEKFEKLSAYLAEKYGITTDKQLEEAIRALPKIDIAPFCIRTKSSVKENVS